MITSITLHLSANLARLAQARQFIHETVQPGCSEEEFIYDLVLAVDEALTNIIVHGYENRDGPIDIQVARLEDGVEIILRDRAMPFDPTQVAPPNLSLPLEQRRRGGLGIYLVKTNTDALNYRRTEDGANELKLVKKYPTRQGKV